MAQVVNLRPPPSCVSSCSSFSTKSVRNRVSTSIRYPNTTRTWTSLQLNLKSNSRFSCFFFQNSGKQEQARKALESALGGKKSEFDKWNKEIKRREATGIGGNSGGGGWFKWFGGSNDDHFWHEAQQISLTILGIVAMYLIIAKGDVMLAVFFNALLISIRTTRNAFAFVSSKIVRTVSPQTGAMLDSVPKDEVSAPISAKESVLRKWARN